MRTVQIVAIASHHKEIPVMVHAQRYVSDELTHFVGKGKTQDEQYDIFVNKILRTGWLTYPPHDLNRPRRLAVDFSQPISTDQALKYEVVCFCDIPETDLPIHVRKYSGFGLAFKKEFLIGKGACPVFYVANESPTSATELWPPGNFMTDQVQAARARGLIDRALLFSVSARQLLDIFAALDAISNDEGQRFFQGGGALPPEECKSRLCALFDLSEEQVSAIEQALRENQQAARTIASLRNFLINEVFSFIKCFEATRPFEDEANYYMEREWRIANHVNFRLDDVSRVFLPAPYARRFRADLPAYIGQISFV
jgi:Putative abortive phage resistance protein AbiGi, antitoxin